MFKLYYTGASTYRDIQTVPLKSIGGFISDTAVPNGIKNSLFSDIGELKIWEVKPEFQYIGLFGNFFFFEGETIVPKMDLTCTIQENILEKYKGIFEYRIGLGPIGGDDNKGYYMEQLSTNKSKPYYLKQEFKNLIDGIPVIFENNDTNIGVGVWLERKFIPTKVSELFGEDSEYWESNDKLPLLDIDINLEIIATESI